MSITLASTRPVARGRQSRGTPAKLRVAIGRSCALGPTRDSCPSMFVVARRLSVRLRAGPIGVISALAGAQRSSLACRFEVRVVWRSGECDGVAFSHRAG